MTTLPLKRILVPTDFSDCARAAFRPARLMAECTGAELLLVHVITRMPFPGYAYDFYAVPPREIHTRLRRESLDTLDGIAREAFAGLALRRIVVAGVAEEEIIEQARGSHADLIVMSTHGWTGLKHWFIGSTAERVVRAAPCPVLTVKPDILAPPVAAGEEVTSRGR